MHGARIKQSTIRKPGLFRIIIFAFLFRQCIASQMRERRFRARGGGTPVQMRLWNVSAIEVLVVQGICLDEIWSLLRSSMNSG
jgi:hypothetical protein